MIPVRRIVVATDFSAPADQAVRRAALIAKGQHAELHLIHGVHPLELYPGPELSPSEATRGNEAAALGARRLLTELADILHIHFGIETRIATRIGRAHTVIAEYAKTVDADLVVVGNRGKSPLLNLLLGSTAARTLRMAVCPVLVVKNVDAAPYQHALVALDFELTSEAAPALACTLAPQARIELLYVYDNDIEERMREAIFDEAFITDYRRRALADAEARLKAAQPEIGDVTRSVITGYPADAIVERATTWQAGLIVLGRSGKRSLQKWLLGSVAKDVVNSADCDVLIINSGIGSNTEVLKMP